MFGVLFGTLNLARIALFEESDGLAPHVVERGAEGVAVIGMEHGQPADGALWDR